MYTIYRTVSGREAYRAHVPHITPVTRYYQGVFQAVMRERGLTAAEVAKACGLKERTVQEVLDGELRCFLVPVYLIDGLGLDLETIFEGMVEVISAGKAFRDQYTSPDDSADEHKHSYRCSRPLFKSA